MEIIKFFRGINLNFRKSKLPAPPIPSFPRSWKRISLLSKHGYITIMQSSSLCAVALFLLNTPLWADATAPLAAAQATKDQAAVNVSAQALIAELGEKAGQPSEAPEFILPDEDAKSLEAAQVPSLFARALATLQMDAWWKTVPTGPDCPAPLRVVASAAEGCVLARQAGCEGAAALLEEARAAADFLLLAQKTGGKAAFPFPAWRGKRGRYGMIADRLLKAAGDHEAAAIHDGWIVDDGHTGELNLDNALAVSALLALYAETKEERDLDAARNAVSWMMQRPLTILSHPNSFTVSALTKFYMITREVPVLSSALEICRLGILPTQLTEGPNAGRWADPQDAKLVYHFQNLRAVAGLLLALPTDSPDRPPLRKALRLGLAAYNETIITQGGSSLDAALDLYCLLMSHESELGSTLKETHTPDAARMIFRAAVEEYRLEHPTISPGTWGHFLLFTSGK